MQILEFIGAADLPYPVAYTLVRSLWQGALVAILLTLLLQLVPQAFARIRYLLAMVSLAAIVATTVLSIPRAITVGEATTDSVVFADAEPQASNEVVGPTQFAQLPAWQTLRRLPHLPPSLGNALQSGLALLYLLGVSILTIRLLVQLRITKRLRQGIVEDPLITATLDSLLMAQNRPRPTVALSDRVDTAMVIGWLRPLILLPTAAYPKLTSAQLQSILLHELAHVRRNDFLVNLLQAFAEVLFFYQPAVWFTSRQLRIEREHCCDDTVVSITGDTRSYADGLLALEKQRSRQSNAASLASSSGNLRGRIERLFNVSKSRPLSKSFLPALTVLTLSLVTGLAAATALDAPQFFQRLAANATWEDVDSLFAGVPDESTSLDLSPSEVQQQLPYEILVPTQPPQEFANVGFGLLPRQNTLVVHFSNDQDEQLGITFVQRPADAHYPPHPISNSVRLEKLEIKGMAAELVTGAWNGGPNDLHWNSADPSKTLIWQQDDFRFTIMSHQDVETDLLVQMAESLAPLESRQ